MSRTKKSFILAPFMDQLPPVKSKFSQFLENVLYIIGAIGLAILIQAYIVRPFIVSGSSMDPIIQDKEYLLIDEISYRFREPRRGEVVVFKAPPEPTKFYIKRIIGLPGETVKINGSTITIINAENPKGFTLDEPYIVYQDSDTLMVKVPAGEYFVMGDNRSGSYDSRGWGTLPVKEIRGRALLRLLPVTKIDYLPGNVIYE